MDSNLLNLYLVDMIHVKAYIAPVHRELTKYQGPFNMQLVCPRYLQFPFLNFIIQIKIFLSENLLFSIRLLNKIKATKKIEYVNSLGKRTDKNLEN